MINNISCIKKSFILINEKQIPWITVYKNPSQKNKTSIINFIIEDEKLNNEKRKKCNKEKHPR